MSRDTKKISKGMELIEAGFCTVWKNTVYYKNDGEPGSSVNTVSGYGLDDRAIEVRFPAEAKGFFL
jgi:hypothetical protein